MHRAIRLLIGIAAILGLPFVGCLMTGTLSVWMDRAFNQSKLDAGGFGFDFIYPFVFGAVAGLITSIVLVIDDRKLKGSISSLWGAIGFVLCVIFMSGLADRVGSLGALILFAPISLWIVGLILYGIWQLKVEK